MEKKSEFDTKGLSTTQLLDEANKKPEYSDNRAWEKQQACDDALEEKSPFRQFRQQINNINKELRELKETIARLQVHKHTDGEVTIPERAVDAQKNSNRVW